MAQEIRVIRMTRHAQVERCDRLAACLTDLGLGEYVLELTSRGRITRLTSTGLCLIFAPDGETLITGYMCSVKRVVAMYSSMGYKRVPQSIFNTVMGNNKKYPYLNEL